MKKLLLIIFILLSFSSNLWAGLWGNQSTSTGAVYQSDCSTITSGFCVDTDDNTLYYWNGVAVVSITGRPVLTTDPVGLINETTGVFDLTGFDLVQPSTIVLTEDTSITAAQVLANKFISNQGASGEIDILLPALSYSISRTVLVEEDQIIEVNPPAGEAFDLSGTMLTADYCIDSPAIVGSKAVFTRMQDASGAWHWSVDIVRGTWIDTGVSD